VAELSDWSNIRTNYGVAVQEIAFSLPGALVMKTSGGGVDGGDFG
jgi:hypothetical protein